MWVIGAIVALIIVKDLLLPAIGWTLFDLLILLNGLFIL